MASKSKRTTAFFCSNCGYESSKWLGMCPACHEWNTFTEEPLPSSSNAKTKSPSINARSGNRSVPLSISEIETDTADRVSSGIDELNRVLGGGIVRGSLILIGGDPGIGKSTLLLQVCRNLSTADHSVLYVSGEESARQIKLRAERIGKFKDSLKIYSETNLDTIKAEIEKMKPSFVIIDSIQTMYNDEITASPGSVSQVRESTGVLLRLAKELGISIFIVGHVTKEGSVAGPRVLEHMVDTVLYFEGESKGAYRIIRSVKNRFGSTDEIGVFEMREDGLREVKNPSEFMLSGRPENSSGSVVACCMEGKRPIMIEIQALLSDTSFNFPRREAIGTDHNRVSLLLAVLEKRIGLRLGNYDAYVNIAGGMRINEPALDLGIIMACASSFKNRPIDDNMVVFGEVGLSGEVRSVSSIEARVNEAVRLGFKRIVLPFSQVKDIKSVKDTELIGVKSISDAMELL
ncbi:MAG: DNA repair protein RadA [Lachnospiraceae bacterium]|nr:DNA repair protein RadA [Lachnospiraceae bacterium]